MGIPGEKSCSFNRFGCRQTPERCLGNRERLTAADGRETVAVSQIEERLMR
jgi:hypothetical protein